MEYFSPAVQLGLTATPRRETNADTYNYFGEPVYVYSLREGINDGYLTPFKVNQVSTTVDEYVYTPDDHVIEGEIEEGKRYKEEDFNRTIEIRERESARVRILMEAIDQNEKTIVFCATQVHALVVRDLINQIKVSTDTNYCVRVTANDGALGEQFLRTFQDNDKTIPTVLTTSQKLSTGVDARNIRNIVLMRPINSMIEFKQIIGRGTRLFDGKDYFTIYDFVNAHQHFSDPAWDGDPIDPDPVEPSAGTPTVDVLDDDGKDGSESPLRPETIRIKLADGKERAIQHMMSTTFWHPDGKPMSAQEFMENLFGNLPQFFGNEQELRELWSRPDTREHLLNELAEKGFGTEQLAEMRRIINADDSDIFDVLAFVAYALPTLTRTERANLAQDEIHSQFTESQQEFLEFALSQYVQVGVDELSQDKLTPLLRLKYGNSLTDALDDLGPPARMREIFADFQQYLYVSPGK
jgi:type I restriction enzyme R subunit